jgi:hypothetical protein
MGFCGDGIKLVGALKPGNVLNLCACRRVASPVEMYTSSFIVFNCFMIYVIFLIERLNEANYYRCGLDLAHFDY